MRQSTEAATVSAASPHPFCFNQPRTVTGEIDAAREPGKAGQRGLLRLRARAQPGDPSVEEARLQIGQERLQPGRVRRGPLHLEPPVRAGPEPGRSRARPAQSQASSPPRRAETGTLSVIAQLARPSGTSTGISNMFFHHLSGEFQTNSYCASTGCRFFARREGIIPGFTPQNGHIAFFARIGYMFRDRIGDQI